MFYLGAAQPPVPAEGPSLCTANERHEWTYGLEKHKAALKSTRPQVDQAKPHCIDPAVQKIQANTRKFCEDRKKAEIGRENRKLVERLENIARGRAGHGVDPRAPPPAASVAVLPRAAVRPHAASAGMLPGALSTDQGSHTRSYEVIKRMRQRAVDIENAGMVRRILAAKPNQTLDTAGHARDFAKHQRARHLLQRLPFEKDAIGGRRGPPAPRTLPPLRPRRPLTDSAVTLVGLGDLFMIGDLRRTESGPASLMDRSQPGSPLSMAGEPKPELAASAPARQLERQTSEALERPPRPTSDLVGEVSPEGLADAKGPNDDEWLTEEETERRRWLAEREAEASQTASRLGISAEQTLEKPKTTAAAEPGRFDGRWVHKATLDDGEVEVIAGGVLRWNDGNESTIVPNGDSFTTDLDGEVCSAKLWGAELVWEDGDVWILEPPAQARNLLDGEKSRSSVDGGSSTEVPAGASSSVAGDARGGGQPISQLTGMSTSSVGYDDDWDKDSMSNSSPMQSRTSQFRR